MSSIIKSGSAPSNTPDGKYFLQTDQACYAELKRGRTYIMTAQEEAKVSHYVIITNADFTVTFNGDSDLVQVGRANNAIVMNVQRACRIDFTQGGNLEFKEGTADLSSRITMGPNASGNVLVTSSLPQQGDFAGQICSLTTGATYVWTGSEWSSTAGTATLPTATSANANNLLISTGSAWAATDKFPLSTAANQMLASDGNGGWSAVSGKAFPVIGCYSADGSNIYANRWMYKKIASRSTSTMAFQFAMNICIGIHARMSMSGSLKVTGGPLNGTLTATPVFNCTSPLCQRNEAGTLNDMSSPENVLRLYFGVIKNDDTNNYDFYLVVHAIYSQGYFTRRSTNVTLSNIIGDEDWTWNTGIGTWDYFDAADPSSTFDVITRFKFSQQIPPCSSSDNGKVLKVVNGVPTWTSA